MQHQKDFMPPKSNPSDNPPVAAGHEGEMSDNPGQALESGDPQLQGRTRGQLIGQPSGQRGEGDQDPESGRHKSVPEM